jgi:hydrogenase maturation protease
MRETLVACIGNMFLGDDGFGCEVARVLEVTDLPSTVKVVDYGIRSLDLLYALLERYENVILVDAIRRGDNPGTIYILQPTGGETLPAAQRIIDPHSMDPMHLLAMARSLGEITAEIFIVGCEPLHFGDELEGCIGLSESVKAAVPEAAKAVLQLINRLDRKKTSDTERACAVH